MQISTKGLDFDIGTKTFYAEVSELFRGSKIEGHVDLVSHKTGNFRRFHLTEYQRDREGEVQAYIYHEMVDRTMRMVVFND